MDDEILEELRRIFAAEVADHRRTLEHLIVVLLRPHGTRAEQDEAAAEVYRIAHGLKGAARAVGETHIVSVAHRIEDQLNRAREAQENRGELALRAARDLLAQLQPPAPGPQPTSAQGSEPVLPSPAPAFESTFRVSEDELAATADRARELLAMLRSPHSSPLGEDVQEAARLAHSLARTAGAPWAQPAAVAEQAARVHALLTSASHRLNLQQANHTRVLDRATLTGTDVHRRVERLREQSLERLADRLERNALTVARRSHKAVRFTFEGAATRVSRQLAQRIADPLLHLVSNAVDHGIEDADARQRAHKPPTGTVRVTAHRRGDKLELSVHDDGRGLDEQRLHEAARERGLASTSVHPALLAGVSTARTVSDVSGRGVGLDAVRRRVTELHGRVDLRSRSGKGTTVALTFPVARDRALFLLFWAGATRYALLLDAVVEVTRPQPGTRPLEDVLTDLRPTGAAHPVAVVLHALGRKVAVLVDRVDGIDRLRPAPLGPRTANLPFVQATAVLSDSSLAFVLNPAELTAALERPAEPSDPVPEAAPAHIVVVDDSATARRQVSAALERAGYRVSSASDGEEAWGVLAREPDVAAVVSDIDMPVLDGLGLLERLRGSPLWRDLPVILLTSRNDPGARARGQAGAAAAFLEKGEHSGPRVIELLNRLLRP